MISLAPNCLLFRTPTGESVPLSAEAICGHLLGNCAKLFDSDYIRHAATAVLHYFKHDLCRQTVTIGEFAEALEKALRGLSPAKKCSESAQKSSSASPTPKTIKSTPSPTSNPSTRSTRSTAPETDLEGLVHSGQGCELFFFAQLRGEVRRQVQMVSVLRFSGLRASAKQLAGSQRWSARCEALQQQIVSYLRDCLSAEPLPHQVSLVIH